MRSGVWEEPEVAALVAAARTFTDATNAVVGDARSTQWLRALLRERSHAALMVLAVRPLREKADLLPELVLNLDSRITLALLAADVIRTFPRRELAARLPFAIEEVVGELDLEGFGQLIDIVVEVADEASLAVVLAAAAAHDDPDVRELAADHSGVERDPSRWGMRRSERPG